ncbi:MAG: aminotransferase [Geminicoccaceae bacterium]|nr:aminotransferase [Geminicoccaceae bacterium]MDW8342306.1 aminotransferase [Geminicoccaceae bacterium]
MTLASNRPSAPNSLEAKDVAYLVHPYTNLRAHEQQGPLVIVRGEGIRVWDLDGKEYIEGLSGLWCASLGFSEKRLVEAARRQMERLPYTHTFAHRSSEPVIALAERLVAIAPPPIAKVFFVNSGSEAIDTAIKLVWYYNNARGRPEKKRIIGRRRAYHGITLAAGHLTGLPYARVGFDLPMSDRFFHVTCPSLYREGLPGEDEEAFADRLAAEIETLIRALGPETVAAFFAEPVMGAGGVVVPPASYFRKIQPILERYDVLMVADEVICGFGRTGNMWGCDTFGIRPDLVICAKQLSAAYVPIAAVLMSRDFYEVIADQSARLGTLGLGYTYSGHPVAAAVALATLDIYETDRILDHVRAVAPRFQARLARLADHPLVGEARGIGLIGGLEIVEDKRSKRQFPQEAKAAVRIVGKILEQGLILRPLPGDVIGICPPLIVTESEIDELFDRLERGLDAALPAMAEAA